MYNSFQIFDSFYKNQELRLMDEDEDQLGLVLQQAIRWAENKSRELEIELIDLEKVINTVQDSRAIVRKKIVKIQKQKEEPQKGNEYHKKIEKIIEETKETLNILNNPTKNANHKIKKQENIVNIQRKPSIPTVNRVKESQSFVPKVNYHFRKKEDVTSKITTMPFANGQRGFKTEKKAMKKVDAPLVSQKSTIHSQFKPESMERKEEEPLEHKSSEYVEFHSFNTSIEDLVEKKKAKVASGGKRAEIDQLITQYEQQQRGYRNNEKKAQDGFLNALGKLCLTRQKLPFQNGLRIECRRWQGHSSTFKFRKIIEYLKNCLESNPLSQQYKISPSQCYKLKYLHLKVNTIFNSQIHPARMKMKLPPKLDINFEMSINDQQIMKEGKNPEEIIQNPYSQQIYGLLSERLKEIKGLNTFDKSSLKNLRMLISICLFEGRRSPVLIQAQKYQEWSQYYTAE